MDLRDYLAGKAIEGVVGTLNGRFSGVRKELYQEELRKMAKAAYDLADAMLEARSQTVERVPDESAATQLEVRNPPAIEVGDESRWAGMPGKGFG